MPDQAALIALVRDKIQQSEELGAAFLYLRLEEAAHLADALERCEAERKRWEKVAREDDKAGALVLALQAHERRREKHEACEDERARLAARNSELEVELGMQFEDGQALARAWRSWND